MLSTAEGQKALLQVWADGSNFVLDPNKQPKAEFARLAKARGWIGGGISWCMHWEACFGEEYPYLTRHTTATTTKKTIAMTKSTPTSGPDLVDRMRRLSISSNESSFSFVSSVPSVQSLDSAGSLGGVILPVKRESTQAKNEELKARQHAVAEVRDPILNTTTNDNTEASVKKSRTTEPTPPPQIACPFWYQFHGFVPTPTATFKNEFARLAEQQGWDRETKSKRRMEALTAEIAFHYGGCKHRLHSWQVWCEELGVEKVPTSITQCRKALGSVFVNLYSLIDHRRNPEVEIIHFRSYTALCRHLRAGNKFPRQCAKQDGFIKALLKRI